MSHRSYFRADIECIGNDWELYDLNFGFTIEPDDQNKSNDKILYLTPNEIKKKLTVETKGKKRSFMVNIGVLPPSRINGKGDFEIREDVKPLEVHLKVFRDNELISELHYDSTKSSSYIGSKIFFADPAMDIK